jgi:hypothetical protein
MVEECVAAAVAWEGFLGGMAFGIVVALFWIAKKTKDKVQKTYTIEDPKRDIKVTKRG